MATTAAVTNPQVGKDIGIGHTGVSRLRSGDRLPSVETMIAIEEAYGWEISRQILARRKGKAEYAREFESALVRKYGAIDVAAPAS